MSKKIGFWSVVALVIGSQIGSGILMLPVDLAPFGVWGQLSWLLAAGGAIILALIFSRLCRSFPITGGPHVYIRQAFGNQWSFCAAWLYWISSWGSTTALIVSIASYLGPLTGITNPDHLLVMQLVTIFIIMIINIFGVQVAGYFEFFFTVMKVIPFILIPVLGYKMCHFEYIFSSEFSVTNPSASPLPLLFQAGLLTMWSFIGLETATTSAGSVQNPQKTIPRAVILGTMLVALIYISNSLVISSLIPPSTLITAISPYALAAKKILGANFEKAIAFCAVIALIGTINAWTLSSSQVAYGAANDKIFPDFFKRTNRFQAPYISVLVSSLGTVPFLLILNSKSFSKQFNIIISVSVIAFLLVYMGCVLAYLKLTIQKKISIGKMKSSLALGGVGGLFCLWGIIHGSICIFSIEFFVFFGSVSISGWIMHRFCCSNKFIA
jgi:APA family basic amino acid/polyamine antiporter